MLAPFFVQLLALGMMSCLQRVRKSVDVLLVPLRSHGLWQSGLWPLGNVCKSVRPVGDAILSAEGSQERECLVDAFVQHLSLGMKSLSAKASQERECLVGAFVQHLALGMKSCL